MPNTKNQDPYVVDDVTFEEEISIYEEAVNVLYEKFGKDRFLRFFALHDSDPHDEFCVVLAKKAAEVDPESFCAEDVSWKSALNFEE